MSNNPCTCDCHEWPDNPEWRCWTCKPSMNDLVDWKCNPPTKKGDD